MQIFAGKTVGQQKEAELQADFSRGWGRRENPITVRDNTIKNN